MNTVISSIPFHSRVATRSVLGMPAAVVVSALVVVNVGVLAAASAWPAVRARDASAAAPTTKANVVKINRRLKGDRLALRSASQEVPEQWDSQQSKDSARPEDNEPQILSPPASPIPADPAMIDCEPVVAAQVRPPGASAEQCVAAIAAYRKAAQVPRRLNASTADREYIGRHSSYA
jgi:hypothetical protein